MAAVGMEAAVGHHHHLLSKDITLQDMGSKEAEEGMDSREVADMDNKEDIKRPHRNREEEAEEDMVVHLIKEAAMVEGEILAARHPMEVKAEDDHRITTSRVVHQEEQTLNFGAGSLRSIEITVGISIHMSCNKHW